jgi:outer membrane protein
MTKRSLRLAGALLSILGCSWGAEAHAQVLTADRAVEIALQRSSQIVGARASVLDARSGLYGAYSGVLPRLSAGISRSGAWVENSSGSEQFSGFVRPFKEADTEEYSTSPGLSGSWNVLDLSALSGLSSARNGLKAAQLSERAARTDVALLARQQFYEVVRAIQLAQVNAEALRLARDDERRVRALFEVGSVSRSDVLSAQVRTAQSELDSIVSMHQTTVQRNNLAEVLGVPASEIGEVDTTLSADTQEYDEAAILGEAERNRPDVQAAEANVKAANAAVNAARFQRLPYVSLSGSTGFDLTSTSKFTAPDSTGVPVTTVTRTETDRSSRASIALNWDFFDGLATDAQNAQARARLLRARDQRDALRRNLASEVREAILGHTEALEAVTVARRAVESATENLNLTQQKYNVGSATILELIDAQVQLQRARSNYVSALAALRVAEALIERVRGR